MICFITYFLNAVKVSWSYLYLSVPVTGRTAGPLAQKGERTEIGVLMVYGLVRPGTVTNGAGDLLDLVKG